MKKFLSISLIVVGLLAVFFLVKPSKSALKSYYSGDAISYNNNVYVTSANSGSLEIFRLDGDKLNLLARVKAANPRFGIMDDFFDAKLSVENNRLYLYGVSHYSLYKYAVGSSGLTLVNQSTNTYWEWYNQVEKFGDNIVTVSAKGIKIFNYDLELIVAHDFTNTQAPYNISGNGNYWLNVDESLSALEVYDYRSRQVISRIPLNFKHSKGNRRAYIDNDNNIYVVDDYYTKKFSLSGQLLAHFKHLDFQGFDVSSSNNNFIYFSNGVGIVKLNKQDLSLNDHVWTNNFGPNGAWAMGLKVVSNAGKDVLVSFNNTNILLLDQDLKLITTLDATEEADAYPSENLFLNLDKPRASVNSEVLLSGGGFLAHENLIISFHGSFLTNAKADSLGRFSQKIIVPSLSDGAYDMKVIGQDSALHYSISFRIE